jgi:hypothetical protein
MGVPPNYPKFNNFSIGTTMVTLGSPILKHVHPHFWWLNISLFPEVKDADEHRQSLGATNYKAWRMLFRRQLSFFFHWFLT